MMTENYSFDNEKYDIFAVSDEMSVSLKKVEVTVSRVTFSKGKRGILGHIYFGENKPPPLSHPFGVQIKSKTSAEAWKLEGVVLLRSIASPEVAFLAESFRTVDPSLVEVRSFSYTAFTGADMRVYIDGQEVSASMVGIELVDDSYYLTVTIQIIFRNEPMEIPWIIPKCRYRQVPIDISFVSENGVKSSLNLIGKLCGHGLELDMSSVEMEELAVFKIKDPEKWVVSVGGKD
jgi:hypothetical protein